MEVEVISRDIIRPSSPTPPNLRTFKLSLLDQLTPPSHYTPIIFFYSSPVSENNLTLTRLKNSLSQTLSEFYPLAGRIKDHRSVDCNDEGVLFCEAKVNYDMCEFLKQPQIDFLYKFLPCPIQEPANMLVHVAVQLNIFACGGIAIGLRYLHKIIDGATLSAFLNRWAAFASSERFDDDDDDDDSERRLINIIDCNGMENIFPSRESQSDFKSFGFKELTKEGKRVTRRFVFDAASLSALKVKAASQLVPNPTRVEVVSSFIWKYTMAASKVLLGYQKSSILTHTVNLRKKIVPPLLENTIGNSFWMAIARHNSNPGEEEEIELHRLVGLLREAVVQVNNDNYTRRLQGNEGFSEISKFFQEIREMCLKEKVDTYAFTSWCKTGYNEVDFGWGKPIWVSYVGVIANHGEFMNLVVLTDSNLDDGIEAWVLIDEHEMAILESNPEFLEFASLNPSIPVTYL